MDVLFSLFPLPFVLFLLFCLGLIILLGILMPLNVYLLARRQKETNRLLEAILHSLQQ